MEDEREYVLDSGQCRIDEEECYEALKKIVQTDPKFVQFIKNAFPDHPERWEGLKEKLHADGVKIAGEDD